ncbi:succinate dehydrogenase assembly factor 2 [Balneatrix alpica]|uniref:FAD assembly factor SdhE n=1 Tax=Balneatrix alpica TaxID=75684 RepID=UPI0005505D2B
MTVFNETEVKRLRWHSRRGMLELDVLLIPFVEEAFNDLEEDDKHRFVKLLAQEDTDLFAWFMGHAQAEDADLARMVRIILERVQPK